MRQQRLGWLGPAIVAVGAAVAAAGVWYMVHVRPVAGRVIDTIAVDAEHELVVRAEDGGNGDRAFVELRDGGRVAWQAIVPRYAGRPGAPGIAWSPTAVSVRCWLTACPKLRTALYEDPYSYLQADWQASKAFLHSSRFPKPGTPPSTGALRQPCMAP